jgi:hypothetical protein
MKLSSMPLVISRAFHALPHYHNCTFMYIPNLHYLIWCQTKVENVLITTYQRVVLDKVHTNAKIWQGEKESERGWTVRRTRHSAMHKVL